MELLEGVLLIGLEVRMTYQRPRELSDTIGP